MDAVTSAVRAMYEQYPYPDGEPTFRVSSQTRLVLSYGRLARPAGRPIRVLDAGCGRGLGTLGHAALEPDVDILGIDVNRVALAEAREAAKRRGLGNVRFQEVDLMTLDGLAVPDGGFDVIYSSGVIHHLANPAEGLARLASTLAPHGLLVLMVYGRRAREPLRRMVEAVDVAIPRDRPLVERLAVARALAAAATDPAITRSWNPALALGDVEFVDRYLNVNETAYDVDGLWALLERADMRFLRWCVPSAWSLEDNVPEGPARRVAEVLADKDRYRLVEQLCFRPQLELIAGRAQNAPRKPPERHELLDGILRVNPEVSFRVEKRNLRGTQRVESLAICHPGREPERLPPGPLATVALMLADQMEPFNGRSLVGLLAEQGIAAATAQEVLTELVRREIVYLPHPADR